MRQIVKPKIIYKYVGDESPQEKEKAEKRVQEFYFSLFDEIVKRSKEKKKTKS